VLSGPEACSSHVHSFLSYCFALTDVNTKYAPHFSAILTGAFVINPRGAQIWYTAIDYCLNAYADIFLKLDGLPHLEYESLVK